jgi:Ca-activated chloride channel family protein
MRFLYPWVLLTLLALIPLAWLLLRQPRKRSGFGYGAVGILQRARAAETLWLNLPHFLRLGLLICLILAAARPQLMDVKTKRQVEGLDIMLALDSSNSMLAMDFVLDGQRRNRLEVVKSVVEDFIQKRVDDRIGLVVFGSQAFTQAPLTLDHRVLLEFLKPVKIGMAGPETAIGDALATAVKRLKDIEAKSKVVILLTDGANTAGTVEPRSAVEAARTLGIKVYAIAVGSDGPVPFPTQGFFGVEYQQRIFKMDTELMKFIAETTGGKYFLASDTKTLQEVYATIDQLEKTRTDVDDPRPRDEFAWAFLLAALGFFVLEQALAASRWRVIP